MNVSGSVIYLNFGFLEQENLASSFSFFQLCAMIHTISDTLDIFVFVEKGKATELWLENGERQGDTCWLAGSHSAAPYTHHSSCWNNAAKFGVVTSFAA